MPSHDDYPAQFFAPSTCPHPRCTATGFYGICIECAYSVYTGKRDGFPAGTKKGSALSKRYTRRLVDMKYYTEREPGWKRVMKEKVKKKEKEGKEKEGEEEVKEEVKKDKETKEEEEIKIELVENEERQGVDGGIEVVEEIDWIDDGIEGDFGDEEGYLGDSDSDDEDRASMTPESAAKNKPGKGGWPRVMDDIDAGDEDELDGGDEMGLPKLKAGSKYEEEEEL